jgi:hypothetical protein
VSAASGETWNPGDSIARCQFSECGPSFIHAFQSSQARKACGSGLQPRRVVSPHVFRKASELKPRPTCSCLYCAGDSLTGYQFSLLIKRPPALLSRWPLRPGSAGVSPADYCQPYFAGNITIHFLSLRKITAEICFDQYVRYDI